MWLANLTIPLLLFILQCSLNPVFADSMDNYSEKAGEYDPESPQEGQIPDCSDLDEEIRQKVQAYQGDVSRIIQHVMNGPHRNLTYLGLAAFVDTFGSRLTATQNLEKAIDYMTEKAKRAEFSVTHEQVTVPHWERNEESAMMILPYERPLTMLGLGGSVGTGEDTAGNPVSIKCDVVVVRSFEELSEKGRTEVQGKIVMYSQPWAGSYGETVAHRTQGAIQAAKLGAVASLVRSITDFSINSPHTGSVKYEDGVTPIPAAAITEEDALMIERLSLNHTVKVELTMGAELYPDVVSRNTLIDHVGREAPEDFAVVSGHIDSWDVGAGAMDDAGGCFVSYHAALVLKELGLQARRTVRTILFTAEEQGLYGGQEYFNQHSDDAAHYQLILESDAGTFNPRGLGMWGSPGAMCVMREVLQLTKEINTTELIVSKDGPDIGFWMDTTAPIGSLHQDPNNYFWFHHTEGDRLEVEDPRTLDKITALWASAAYVAADIDIDFQNVTLTGGNNSGTTTAPALWIYVTYMLCAIVYMHMF